METVWRDLRHAVRGLRRSPMFTIVAVATLAAGIAANAVVFAALKAVVVNPLPYGDPDRLVTIREVAGRSASADTVSHLAVQEFGRRAHAFESISQWGDFMMRPVLNGRVEMLRGLRVSGDFFDTLGVRMLIGRSFLPEEDAPDRRNTLVLTYAVWAGLFGSDPSVLGRSIPTVGGAFTVVGVLPPDFHPLHMSNPAELPAVFAPSGIDPGRDPWMPAIGRLSAGVTIGQAQAELNTIMRALAREDSYFRADASVVVTPLHDELVGRFDTALWMLQASVLALLLLSCANVATLTLARTVGRETELAVRAALGAGRAALVRQLATEGVVIAAAAAGLGLPLAWAATRFIAATGDANIPRIGELAPDPWMLVFGIAAAAIATVLFAVAPCLIAFRTASAALRSGRASTGRRSQHVALRVLIGGELALAFALVLVTALLANSYLRLMGVNPGYEPRHLLTLSLLPDDVHYPTFAAHLGYFDAVVARMQGLPGVEDAAYASTLPLSHPSTRAVYIREHPLADGAEAPSLDTYLVSANYLEVMKIRVLAGRGFTPADSATSTPVALVSESTARTQFRGEDPIGQHIRVALNDTVRPWATIVGIVGDVHQYGLDRKPDAAVYIPFAQVQPSVQGWASLVVRSTPAPERMESAVRTAMRAVDPLQPIFHMQPMARYIALSVSQRTFALALVTAFGVLGLILAAAGVYSVVSYVVEQRTREMGLRLALGATPAAVRWMIVRQVLAVAMCGIAAGFAAAAISTRGISALLFGVTRFDFETTVGVGLALVAAALVACARPAGRAARVDPATSLRSE